MKIHSLRAHSIPNSRHKPAIEIIVNKKYKAAAPSGASTGTAEVKTFPKQGIQFSIDFINTYQDLIGMQFEEFSDLAHLDHLIPTVGGNTIIALQFALLKAMSDGKIWKFLNPKAKHLPIPAGNVVGGGAHSKEQSTDIQEFLLLPESKSFYDNAFTNAHIHKKMKKKVNAYGMTDEGAWITRLSNIEVLEMLSSYLEDTENTLGIKVGLGMDVAATEFYKKQMYVYNNYSQALKKHKLTTQQQITFVNDLIKDYKLKYVEDPLDENEFKGFSKISKKTLVCGDDLVTTNLDRLKEAIKHNSMNCMIIKPNQIGSVVKTKEVVDYAHKHNIKTIISHRSGETYDATISHLAVAWNIPYLKCGIYGKERKAKLDECIKIEKEM